MKSIGLLLVLECAAVSLLPAQDASEATTQSKIIALEKAWNQAYKLGDRKALDTLLDDQIVLINDDGSVQTKTQFLASVKATNSQDQQVAPESMSVHVFGSTPSRPEFFEPKESREANATCGANASLTLGCSTLGNACVSPLTPRQFSTERHKGHAMCPESKRHRIF